jgi:hypothetical protein
MSDRESRCVNIGLEVETIKQRIYEGNISKETVGMLNSLIRTQGYLIRTEVYVERHEREKA